MKIYLAKGESRNFEFSAIGETEAEAEKNIIRAFEAHARHNSLPLHWWREHADFYVLEMDTNKLYRDRSEINSKWYHPEDLTDEEIDQGITMCDCCEIKGPSIDMFWSMGECETESQEHAMKFMEKNGYQCICEDCFDNCTEEV